MKNHYYHTQAVNPCLRLPPTKGPGLGVLVTWYFQFLVPIIKLLFILLITLNSFVHLKTTRQQYKTLQFLSLMRRILTIVIFLCKSRHCCRGHRNINSLAYRGLLWFSAGELRCAFTRPSKPTCLLCLSYSLGKQ